MCLPGCCLAPNGLPDNIRTIGLAFLTVTLWAQSWRKPGSNRHMWDVGGGEGVVIFVLDVVGGVVRVLVGVVVVIVVVVALVVRQRLRARLGSHRDADARADAGESQGRRR